MKGIDHKTSMYIKERPKHLDRAESRSQRTRDMAWIAETLKIIDKSQEMVFSEDEFKSKFTKSGNLKSGFAYLKITLKKFGIKKPRVVMDNSSVHIWSNDER